MRSIVRRARQSHADRFPESPERLWDTYSGSVPAGPGSMAMSAGQLGPTYNYGSTSERELSDTDYDNDNTSGEVTFGPASAERLGGLEGKGLGHRRNASTMTTASRINKRFSVHPQPQAQPQPQPQPPSPTGSTTTEAPLPKYEPVPNETAVGEEPGINIDTMEVDIPDGVGSQVTIVDYCDADCQVTNYDVPKGQDSVISGSSDRRMLGHRLDDAIAEQPSWARVRWIVVNGLSWEALRPIAAHYNLHPLALEDVLDIPQRAKVEVHDEQVFCCYPMHTLHVTPTPFSFLHSLARRCVIKIYQAIVGIRLLSIWIARICASIHTLIAAWLLSLRISSGKDAEQQQPEGAGNICSVHGKAHTRAHSVCSSDDSVSSTPHAAAEKAQHDAAAEVYLSSTWSDSATVLGEEEAECVPFYTLEHGTLCSNTELTPIEATIRDLPARSMYEWNRGNLALHNEVLRNMRIQGSANSVEIAIEQVSVFLLPNTVITIFERSAPAVYGPIQSRLMSPLTLLRKSNDASVLVQAIIDASVDLVHPILQMYRSQLSRLQVEGVHQPNLRHTRALHAFMTDLTMMRTLVRSLASLVDNLRLKSVWVELGHKDTGARARGAPAAEKPISAKAAEYLGDVVDHAKAYLEDLDGMYAQSQTLNSLIFDTISIRAGDSVKMLSLVSVIFLPLTFLTGYFGMNFKSFTTLNHDVGYYWLVSTPAAAALTVFLMYPTAVSQAQEWWSWAKLQV